MSKEKYGLIEDMPKFIKTEGEEGIAQEKVDVKVDVKKEVDVKDVKVDVKKDVKVDIKVDTKADVKKDVKVETPKIEDSELYKILLAKNVELEKREIPEAISPQLKEIQDWSKKNNRPIEDWIKFQDDPKDLKDLEIVRKIQRLNNPTLSTAELDFYIKKNFISDSDDDEDEVMNKSINFKKEVAAGRQLLENNRIKFDTKLDVILTDGQKDDIKFAKKVRDDNSKLKTDRDTNAKALKLVIDTTDKISLDLAEGKALDFAIPAESKKDQEVYLNEMKRWENEDGSTNQQVMLSDSYRIKHFDEIVKLAYQQGKNDQLEDTAKVNTNIPEPTRNHKTVSKGKFGFAGRGSARRKQV